MILSLIALAVIAAFSAFLGSDEHPYDPLTEEEAHAGHALCRVCGWPLEHPRHGSA